MRVIFSQEHLLVWYQIVAGEILAISCYCPRGDNSFQTISKITILLSLSGFALISVTRRMILNIAYGECIARNVRIFVPLRNKLHFNQTCFNHFIKLNLRCFI